MGKQLAIKVTLTKDILRKTYQKAFFRVMLRVKPFVFLKKMFSDFQ